MSASLAWPADGRPVLVLLLAAACYLTFHYGFHADQVRRRRRRRGRPVDEVRVVMRQRAGGVLCLGVVPAAAGLLLSYGAGELGLGLERPGAAALFVAFAMALWAPILFAVRRTAGFTASYPRIRAVPWSPAFYLANAATWGLYHLAYELFFRGFLLFPLVPWAGAWGAIAISSLAYVFAHLPSRYAAETVCTLPMGVILAAAALYTGGLWAAFAVHWLIAVTADTAAARQRSAAVDAAPRNAGGNSRRPRAVL